VPSVSPRERAVYRGEVYQTSGRPPGKVALHREGFPEQVVPISELDEWYTVRTWGTFLGHEFEIYFEDEDRYGIGVVGTGDGHWLAATWAKPEEHPEVSFNQLDRFTYEASVPKHMVSNIHEVRTDALGPWRKQQEERESRES
jgi:hypothetical protein